MNFHDDLRAADTALDHRLYAAGNALREGSATQVDATSALRVILLHADPAPRGAGAAARSVAALARDHAAPRAPATPGPGRQPVTGPGPRRRVPCRGAARQGHRPRDPCTDRPDRHRRPVHHPGCRHQDRHLGPGAVRQDRRAGRRGDLQTEQECPRRATVPRPAGLHHRQPGVPAGSVALAGHMSARPGRTRSAICSANSTGCRSGMTASSVTPRAAYSRAAARNASTSARAGITASTVFSIRS